MIAPGMKMSFCCCIFRCAERVSNVSPNLLRMQRGCCDTYNAGFQPDPERQKAWVSIEKIHSHLRKIGQL